MNKNVFLSSNKISVVEIDTSQLEYGQNYTIVLELTNSIKEVCSFYYNFTINYPPSAYSLSVDPNTGIENSQKFTITVNKPVSINNYYPLKYSFGYLLNEEKVYLSSYTQNPKFSFVLGYVQQKVSLFVLIFDSLGDTTQLNSALTLQIDPLFNSSAYLEQQIESNSMFYPQLSTKIVNIINLVILRNYNLNGNYSSSIQLLNDAFEYSSSLIISYIKASIYSSNLVDNVLSILNQLTSNPFLISNNNTSLTRQALSLLFGLASSSGVSSTQAGKIVKIVNNSLVINRATIYNNTKGINTVTQILSDTYNTMLKKLKSNENIEIGNGLIQITVKTVSSAKLSNLSVSSTKNPKASVTFPSNFTIPSIPSNDQIAIFFTFFNSISTANYSTPTIITINLYDMTNSTELIITNLNVPINISIPVYNLNANDIKCYYLDEIAEN